MRVNQRKRKLRSRPNQPPHPLAQLRKPPHLLSRQSHQSQLNQPLSWLKRLSWLVVRRSSPHRTRKRRQRLSRLPPHQLSRLHQPPSRLRSPYRLLERPQLGRGSKRPQSGRRSRSRLRRSLRSLLRRSLLTTRPGRIGPSVRFASPPRPWCSWPRTLLRRHRLSRRQLPSQVAVAAALAGQRRNRRLPAGRLPPRKRRRSPLMPQRRRRWRRGAAAAGDGAAVAGAVAKAPRNSRALLRNWTRRGRVQLLTRRKTRPTKPRPNQPRPQNPPPIPLSPAGVMRNRSQTVVARRKRRKAPG